MTSPDASDQPIVPRHCVGSGEPGNDPTAICVTCQFYFPLKEVDPGHGECRRHSPVAASIDWPQVWEGDWCGDWVLTKKNPLASQ
jgi:hypothetical protein